jgi:hypothetical protein
MCFLVISRPDNRLWFLCGGIPSFYLRSLPGLLRRDVSLALFGKKLQFRGLAKPIISARFRVFVPRRKGVR